MKQQTPILLTAALALSAIGRPAHAAPLGATWIEIPIVDSPDDPVDLTGYRSFDLYVFVSPGDRFFYVDSGFGEEFPLACNMPIFEHPVGNNLEPSPILQEFFPDIVYDTFLAMGNLEGWSGELQLNSPFSTVDPMNLLTSWGETPPPSGGTGPGGGVFPDGQFFQLNSLNQRAIWIGRFTIDFQGDYEQSSASLSETIEGYMHVYGEGDNGEFGNENDPGGSGRFYARSPFGLSGPVMHLDPFAMIGPLEGGPAVNPNHVVLEWEEVVPPVVPPQKLDPLYYVRVTTDFRHWNNIVKADNLTEESYTIPPGLLEPCTKYYWHVFGNNGYDRGPATNWRSGEFTTTYSGDVNADGAVDTADLGMLIDSYLTSDQASDLNGDGIVDTADLGQLITNFSSSCK